MITLATEVTDLCPGEVIGSQVGTPVAEASDLMIGTASLIGRSPVTEVQDSVHGREWGHEWVQGYNPLQSILISARGMELVGGQVRRLPLAQNLHGLNED